MSQLTDRPSRPPIVKTEPRTLTRTWGTETIVAETDQYLGKVLRYKGGRAGGLQYHREKVETFHLVEGSAFVDYDRDGALKRVLMVPGETYHIPAGAPHRFEAITDCLVVEWSTPVYDDRVRVEEEYGVKVVGDEPGLPTTTPKKPSGWPTPRPRLSGSGQS